MAEAKRVQCRLNSLSEDAAGTAHSFWSDRGRGFVLATLQDRAGQASSFVEACRLTLERIWRAMFPLDETLTGLKALLKAFRVGRAIKNFVREQCIGGAMVALAFCRVHHPDIDLAEIGGELPPQPGGGRVQMGTHYAVARGPAECIVDRIERETRAERQ